MTLIVKTLSGNTLYHNSPDGGWAWVVLASAFFIQGLVLSWIRSLGIFYNDFLEEYQITNTQTSLILSIATAMMGLAAPFASILIRKFGARKVLLVSGALCSLGLMITAFGYHIWAAYLGIGIIWGTGFSWSYTCIVSQVNIYFTRWRGIANGIAASGSAVGSFLIPLLAQYLLYKYGWRGALILFSGIALNICVFASFVRPISAVTIKQMPKYRNLKYADKATNLDEIQAMTVSLEVLDYIQQAEYQKSIDVNKTTCDRICKFVSDYWLLGLLAVAEFSIGFSLYYPLTYIVPFAKELRCSDEEAALLLSMTAVGDIICRPISGIFFSWCTKLERKVLFILGLVFLSQAGISFLAIYATDFHNLLIYAIAYGCLFGIFVTAKSTATPALFGVENVVKFIGPMLLVSGVSAFIGSPIAGHLVDIYGTFRAVYWYAMGGSVVTFILLLIGGISAEKLGAVLPEHRTQKVK